MSRKGYKAITFVDKANLNGTITMHFVTIIGLLLALSFLLVYVTPQVYRFSHIFRWRFYPDTLVLTYDDGPDKETTSQLLDLLQDLDVKATFYLVGFRAKQHPEVVHRIQNAKHEIGSHMFFHINAFKSTPWKEYREVLTCDSYLQSMLGYPVAYRPPFGKVTLPTMLWLLIKGRRIDWWSIATNDTAQVLHEPEVIANNIISSRAPVVLMHCHHKDANRRKYVLQVTRILVEKARQNNIKILTMTEFCNRNHSPR
jgi:peptidoglycan/xylan/chitin deacetylase (PgdA/CDA1 family)